RRKQRHGGARPLHSACLRSSDNIPKQSSAGMQDPNCVFCKIAAGSIPSRIIMQNERAMALLDAFPLAAGHTLVIPKSHYSRVEDMSQEDALAVFEVAWKIV